MADAGWWSRLWSAVTMADDELTPEEALASVRDARARFEDALRRARAAAYTPTLDVADVQAEFTRIEAAVPSAGGDDLQTLCDDADRLSRLRAYVLPEAEIQIEGKSAFADLTQWGVPPAILGTMQTELLASLGASDKNVARAGLRALYEAYDYWAWYVDWYAGFMRRVAWYLLGLEAIALAVTLNRFVYGDVVLGFLCAGVCGALVSVISKMPPLIADAESNAYVRRILMRVGTGVAAALIGGGFLASGIVTVTLPNSKVTITDMIELCGKDACRTDCREAGWFDWAVAKLTGRPALADEACGQNPDAPLVPRCTTGGFLLLLALGLILGFSERALTSFEDKVFTPPAKPT